MDVDLSMLVFGTAAGVCVGAVFFAGLALGMRLALDAGRPARVLLFSAALRIALLLGIGWSIAQAGSAALAGYALAFVLMRVIAIGIARSGLPAQPDNEGV